MTESQMEKIAAEVSAAMKQIAAKHGVTFSRGNIRWSDQGMKFTGLSLNETTVDGTDAKAKADFDFWAPLMGVSKSAFNVFYKAGKEELKIVGFKNRNKKDKFLLESRDGKKYKAGINFLKTYLPEEALRK